jgi:hypothetical protein
VGVIYEAITPELQEWIARQHVFFVATAPLASEGHVNCSPKGMDSLRVLGPRDIAYVDLTGSGIETVAHLRENGRIVFMFCAFEGPPKIVRMHGAGRVIDAGTPEFESLRPSFPDYLGTRAMVRASITRISDSCGYSVPRLDYVGDRDTLSRWIEKKGSQGLTDYRAEKNSSSVDGLPGLSLPHNLLAR